VYGADASTGRRLGGVLESRTRSNVVLHLDERSERPRVPGVSRLPDGIEALAEGEVDLALCPAEELGGTLDTRIEIVGVPERGDPRDALLARRGSAQPLWQVSAGSRIGVRDQRAAGLLRVSRPDLVAVEEDPENHHQLLEDGGLSGLITSMDHISVDDDADRLGEVFPTSEWIPGPGQAALVLLARSGEPQAREAGGHLIHPLTMLAVQAELETVRCLSLDDEVGVGVVGLPYPGGFRLKGLVITSDGRQAVTAALSAEGLDAPEAGERLAQDLLDRGAGLLGSRH